MARIDVTGVSLTELVKAAYDLSVPQGLGFLHVLPGGLTDEEAEELVQEGDRIAVNMDYVHGRACKFMVRRDGDKLTISAPWYDHTDEQLRQLLERVGLPAPMELAGEHGLACNCRECVSARGGRE